MTAAVHRTARAVLALVVAVLATVGGIDPAVGAEVPPGYTTDRLEAAAWWLTTELDRATATARAGQPVDVGLTLDHVLALLALGYERDAVDRTLSAIEPRVAAYVGMPDTPTSGALGKALATALAAGRGPRYGGVDLEGELRANMVTEGRRTGEFSNYRGSPASQGFTQSWSILALARTGGGVPPQAVAWLLQMQCPAGGFRSGYPNRPTDPCPRGGHTDATAISIQALLALHGRSATATTAIERAASWMESIQHPDGAFDDNDILPRNTNSTGLAAQALLAAGHGSRAGLARKWVEARQIWCTAEKAHRGAFTYSVPATVPGGDGPRAVPQAVLALGLPAYGAFGGGSTAEADQLYCPVQDGEPPIKPPPVIDERDPDRIPDVDPTPDPEPPLPGGGGEGTGGTGGSGNGPGTQGPTSGGGPLGRSDDPTPDGGPSLSSSMAKADAEPGPDVEAQRARSSERADAPLDIAGVSGRPRDSTQAPRPDPLGPTFVAAGLGLSVIVVAGIRTGSLTTKRRKLASAVPAARPNGGTGTAVPPATGPADGGVDTRTADLPAGPYG